MCKKLTLFVCNFQIASGKSADGCVRVTHKHRHKDQKKEKERRREGVDSPSERHEEQVSNRRVRVSVCVLPSP